MRFGNRGYSRTALVGAILVLVFAAPLATAQSGAGGIQGIVQDRSGATIPNAILLLKGAGGSVQKTVSGEDGKYSFADPPPGTYGLTAFAPGFQVALSEKISVEPGLPTELKVRLESSVSELKIGPEIGGLSTPVTSYPLRGVPLCDLFPDGLILVWNGAGLTFKIGELERNKAQTVQTPEAPKKPNSKLQTQLGCGSLDCVLARKFHVDKIGFYLQQARQAMGTSVQVAGHATDVSRCEAAENGSA